MADGKIVIETGLDSSGIKQGIGRLGNLAKTGLAAVTGAITGVVTALSGAGIAVAKVGSDFETAMAKTSTLFGDVNVDTANLNTKVLELSNSTGVASSAIGESLYNALSAGIPATEDMGTAMTYMEQCAKLAKAGFTDVDTVVTSTAKVLNAYKMDVNETGNVHKILMQVQNKGITTVGELGASLAQVTPTAAAMNVSFEQVGAALATMTAQGTPTAQATTQLNSLFAELGKQGTVASKALEKSTEGTKYAGKGFSDLMKEGVPLNEVLDLMGVKADMSDQSLIDMFGSIEAGKAALAMSGINAQQYTSNLEAMATETDVVGEAYEKVSDTFQEKSQIFIEGAKNLGIAIYAGMETPLKGAAEAGIGYVQQLTDAFTSGGLQGAVAEAGSIFADIAVKAAEQAPGMIDAAVSVIESFVGGLIDNKERLGQAAIDIVQELAGGVARLLPEELRKPAEEAINAMTDSFKDGGLQEAAKTITTTFENIIKTAGSLASVTLPVFTKALDFCGGNLEVLVPLLIGGYTAIKGFSIASKVAKKIGLMSTAYTAASAALDLYIMANGYEAIATAASTGALTLKQIAVGLLTKQIGLSTAATAAWNAVMTANPIGLVVVAVAALTAGLVAYSVVHDSELEMLVKDCELRTETIGKLDEEAEAWNQTKVAREESIKANEGEINQTQALWNELQTIVDANGNIQQGYESRAGFITGELSSALGIEIQTIDGVIQKYDELQASVQGMIEQKRAELVLQSQEEAYTAAINDRFEKQKEIHEAEKELIQTKKDLIEAENAVSEAYAKGGPAQVAAAKSAVDIIQKEYDKQSESINNAKDQYQEYQSTISNYEGLSAAIISGDAAQINDAVNTITFNFKTAGEATRGELEKQVTDLQTYATDLQVALAEGNTGVTQQMVDNAANMVVRATGELDKFQVNARASMAESGNQANAGLQSTIPTVEETAKMIAEGTNLSLKLKDHTDAGQKAGNEYNLGLAGQKNSIDSTSMLQAQSTNDLLGSVDATSTGSATGGQYNTGLFGQNGNINATATGLATLTNAGLGAVNTNPTGMKLGTDFVGGVGSQATNAQSSGKSLADGANSGADSADSYSSGSNFGSGFVRGIGNWVKSAIDAAATLAKSALKAIKNVLNIKSPSKETAKMGGFFGEGFSLGIAAEEKNAEKASIKLSEAALNGIDVSAMAEKLRNTVQMENLRMGAIVSATVNRRIVTEYEDSEAKQEDLLNRLAVKISGEFLDAFAKAGLTVMVDKKVLGEVTTPEVNKNLGRISRRRI